MTQETFMSLIEKLEKILSDAQAFRNIRNKWIGDELEWVMFERQTMFDAVNNGRGILGMSPVSMAQVCKAESNACGHSDYTHKFALYCAEVVRDGQMPPLMY